MGSQPYGRCSFRSTVFNDGKKLQITHCWSPFDSQGMKRASTWCTGAYRPGTSDITNLIAYVAIATRSFFETWQWWREIFQLFLTSSTIDLAGLSMRTCRRSFNWDWRWDTLTFKLVRKDGMGNGSPSYESSSLCRCKYDEHSEWLTLSGIPLTYLSYFLEFLSLTSFLLGSLILLRRCLLQTHLSVIPTYLLH